MKSKVAIFRDKCGFGLIGDETTISLTKNDIYEAMEAYADQFRKWCTDPPPKDGTHIIAKWGIIICEAYYLYDYNTWKGTAFISEFDPDGWIPVPK